MNVDIRLVRRTARGACSAALIGSLLGGCASWNKPRFWDKEDVTSASATNASQRAANPSPAAPTVVAADHSMPADPPSGRASAFDFPDLPPSTSTQTAVASDSQPAPPSNPPGGSDSSGDVFGPAAPLNSTTAKTAAAQNKANDPFADTSEPPVIAPPTRKAAAASVTSTPAPAASPKAGPSPNPFAETENPVFVTSTQRGAGADSAVTAGPLPATPTAPQSQPASAVTAASSASAAPLPTTTAPSAPTSPEPEWSAQSDAASSPEAPPTTAPAPPPATPVAATTHANDTYDAFGDPMPSTPGKAATVSPPVQVADNLPTCAAPVAKAVMPSQTGATAAKPANAAPWNPARAPASLEQATPSKAGTSSSEQAQLVIPDVKERQTPNSGSAPPADKMAAQSVEKVSAANAASVSDWDVEKPQPAISSQKVVVNAMICDSKTVRGRFTGIDHNADKASPHVEPLFRERAPAVRETAPAAVPAAPPQPVACKKAPPKQPEQLAAPLPSADAVKPAPQAAHDAKSADQTAREPAKPASGVVNALAQVGQSPALDPFALEQTVDNSAADATNPAHSLAPPKAESPPPLHGEEPPFDPASVQLVETTPTVAPDPPHESAGMAIQTGFAIGLGIGVGLAAILGLWLRLRPKAAPTGTDENLKTAA